MCTWRSSAPRPVRLGARVCIQNFLLGLSVTAAQDRWACALAVPARLPGLLLSLGLMNRVVILKTRQPPVTSSLAEDWSGTGLRPRELLRDWRAPPPLSFTFFS